MEHLFRTLKANEVECRVSTVKENGLSLLLYKDARCDMNILDETLTPYGWQRRHSRDNANCTISIWDKEKKQWIEKEDTGTESYTEKEKGLASDSFKRAGFNLGIGRELYTAPFIWITDAKIVDSGRKDSRGKTIYTTYDRFYVGGIKCNKNKVIIALTINDAKTRKEVFKYGNHIPVDCKDLIKVAHEAGYTPKQVDRVCYAEYGCTMEYITQQEHDEILDRLNKAK